MSYRVGRVKRLVVAVLLLAFAPQVWSQSGSTFPENEYKKQIRVNEDIQPLGDKPFGEQISLYDGSVSFMQTDIELPGNGLPIVISRTLRSPDSTSVASQAIDFVNNAFVDWELSVPKLETLSAETQWVGAKVWFFYGEQQRCTRFAAGGAMVIPTKPGSEPINWEPNQWWHGYQLKIPGRGRQDVLLRNAAYSNLPQMLQADGSPMVFPAVTKDHWVLGCLPTTDNGQPGEAFLAIAPDGTKYWLTWLSYKNAATISSPGGGALARRLVSLQARRVEDRFGNWLTYTYDADANLTAIDASDGRHVTLAYESWTHPSGTLATGRRITSITAHSSAGTRVWTYTYEANASAPRLTAVQQPDGSSWQFDLAGINATDPNMLDFTGCMVAQWPQYATTRTATVRNPSGLLGTFVVRSTIRGRSYVPGICGVGPGGVIYYTVVPLFVSASLIQRTYSGAGITPQTWNYSYSPSNESFANSACATAGTCATTVWTDEVNPDGSSSRYTFSNRYDATESLLKRKDSYAQGIGSALVRSDISNYATSGPWPSRFGAIMQGDMNYDQMETLAPLSQQIIEQDQDHYEWNAVEFDAFAHVTKAQRGNLIAGQATVEERYTFINDMPRWVLGLPVQTEKIALNVPGAVAEVVGKNEYDPASLTLSKRYQFGQPVMSYTFNAQGQLASFTDGNSKTTTLGNYKRGIPQAIGYPDSTSQTLAVDDFGQISAITDQAGNTTSYTYDAIGRLASISYPAGDEQAWLPKTFTYDYVTGAERGIAGAHWRRTISKGASRAVTFFDAYLRPVLADSYIDGVASSISSTRTDYDWKGQKAFQSFAKARAVNTSDPVVGLSANLGSDPLVGVVTQYDALGRATASIQTSQAGNLTTATAYLSGARKQVTDPKGYSTITSYQVFDTPSYDVVIGVQAPEGVNQTITRDIHGHPRAIHQWGTGAGVTMDVTKKLFYDSYYRLCRTYEPESNSEVMAYDPANNVEWTAAGQAFDLNYTGCGQEQVAAAAKTTRVYDPMNRVQKLETPAGTPQTLYTYDPLGNIKTAETGIATWAGTRNKLGLLMSEQLGVTGNGINVISYTHDAYGSTKTVSYPDATVVDYAPDALGRPTKAGAYASNVQYFPDGDIASFIFGNNTLYLVEKNDRQLLKNFSYAQGSTFNLSQDYSYDANGNITAITDLANAGQRSKSMTYDQLNRLTSATSPLWNGTESYAYDALNNIRSRTLVGAVNTYNYDGSNRLTSISGAQPMTLGYDDRGNVINKNGNTLVFNDKNQLTSIPGFGSYDYDASGRRVRKSKPNGDTTYYFYTQGGQLLYALDTATAKATSYIYLGKKMIARNESLQLAAPNGISFSNNDGNGSYTVNWTASPGATRYSLDESTDGGASWNTLNNALTAISYAITGKPGGAYRYRVKSCAGTQCTAYTTSDALGVAPALPGISVPGAALVGSYVVSWTAPVSTTAYDVQEQINGGAWNTLVADTTVTTITLPGTTSGSYKYQVRAKNAYGDRGWVVSNTVTVDTTLGDPPPAPASVTVPATSYNGNATISWSSAVRATRYKLTQMPGGTLIYDGPNLSASVSNLASGTYSFQVTACSSIGCSSAANSGNLVVTRAPTAAPTLTAPPKSANGSYTLSWVGVPGATSYTLQENVNGGGWTQVQANGNTSWATNGRANGSYAYRVQACNVAGCGEWSSTGTTTVLLPPPAPIGVMAPATAYGAFTVTWNATPTATGYDLYQSYNGGGWVLVYSGSATSITITPNASSTYWYSLYAKNESGVSTPTQTPSLTTVTLAPTAAPGLSAPASNNSGSYTVSWTGVSGATSYTLQEQVNGGAWNTVQANGAGSWGASGRGNGTYGYRVQACNAGGCGPWSNIASTSVTLIPGVPSVWISRYTINSKMEGYQAEWTAMTGATYYQVQRVDDGFLWYQGGATSVVIAEGERPLDPAEVFDVRVRACNAIGCSAWSP